MNGFLKLGIALGATVGAAYLLKKLAPEVVDTAVEKVKQLKPADIVTKVKSEVFMPKAETVEFAEDSAEIPAVLSEEWPDLSELPAEPTSEDVVADAPTAEE